MHPPDPPAADEERFRELFRRYYPTVTAYAARRNTPASADDVVAETFATAWRRLADVPEEPRTLPWLLVVARHATANTYRGQHRFARIATRLRLLPSEAAHHDAHPTLDEHDFVRVAIAQLRPDDKEVIRLAIWDELPHEQIAVILGCSTKAVAVRLHRAKARLRAKIEAMPQDDPSSSMTNGLSR